MIPGDILEPLGNSARQDVGEQGFGPPVLPLAKASARLVSLTA